MNNIARGTLYRVWKRDTAADGKRGVFLVLKITDLSAHTMSAGSTVKLHSSENATPLAST